MKDLKRVDASYLETAPITIRTTVSIEAPVEFVFATFEDADAWVHCFKPITRVDWTSERPFGKGTTRTIDLDLPGMSTLTVDEEFTVWEQNKQFSFVFLRSTKKVFGAAYEDYQFVDQGNDTTDVIWNVGLEGAGIFGFLFKFMVGQTKKDNQTAMNNFKTFIEDAYRDRS